MTARVGAVSRAVLLLLVVAALVYCGWFRVTGGRWERVETPSMGTTAPVGSLLWVRPVVGDVAAGEVVTFRRPDGRVFTHRVLEVRDDGALTTGGDLSGEDPWVVERSEVLGRVDRAWPVAGTVVRALPLLVVGAVATWGLVLLLRRRDRRRHRGRTDVATAVTLLGVSTTAAAALVVYSPLLGAQQLGADEVREGAVRVSYVSTGLLPVRLADAAGHDLVLGPGEAGSVTTTRLSDERLTVDVEPAVPAWSWWALVAGCFAPAVASAARPRRQDAIR